MPRSIFASGHCLLCKVFDPETFLYQPSTYDTFDQFCALTNGIEGNNGEIREPAEAEGQRYCAYPHEAAVKEEGDKCLTTGAQSEVGGKGIGSNGHQRRDDTDQGACQVADIVAGIIQHGERTGNYQQGTAKEDAAYNR